MRLLLDTAVLIYAAESPDRLTKRASTALRNPDNVLEISAVSLTEIALKASTGKLAFSEGIVRQTLKELEIRILAYTAEHAFRLFTLPIHHRDPFDRQIIAQALYEDIPVVTSDRQFARYNGIKIMW